MPQRTDIRCPAAFPEPLRRREGGERVLFGKCGRERPVRPNMQSPCETIFGYRSRDDSSREKRYSVQDLLPERSAAALNSALSESMVSLTLVIFFDR